MEDSYIVVMGKKVKYKSCGNGSDIVLLHGIPTHSGLWDGVISYLSKKYRVHAFDLLGFGESQRFDDSSQINIKSQAKFFVEVFKEISLKEIILVGHDIGGGIAQIIAVNNPQMLKALVLIDSVCYDSWPIELLKVHSKVELLFEHLPQNVIYDLFLRYIGDGLYNKDKVKDVALKYWRYIEGEDGIKSFLKAVESFDSKYTMEISHGLKSIRIPTLILWGRHDTFIRLSYGYRLSEDIKNSTIHVIEDGGHFLPEEQPQKISMEISSFIEKR